MIQQRDLVVLSGTSRDGLTPVLGAAHRFSRTTTGAFSCSRGGYEEGWSQVVPLAAAGR